MRIARVTGRHSNDFWADYECEQCGHIMHGDGYSDANYFNKVIPNAICPKCGKSASGENAEEQQKRLGRTYEIYAAK